MGKRIRHIVLCNLFLVCILFLTTIIYCRAATDELTNETFATHSSPKPLVIYYSRTGTTRIIAQNLAKHLPCEMEEIVSRKNRHLWGTITCVLDQLFDRDDEIQPTTKNISAYNPLIIASPVWIHRISSPMRTFLKYSGLKQSDAFLILTNNGNYDAEDERNIIQHVKSYGITITGCFSVCTSEKDEHALEKHTLSIVKDIALAN